MLWTLSFTENYITEFLRNNCFEESFLKKTKKKPQKKKTTTQLPTLYSGKVVKVAWVEYRQSR